jgi:hypothetical protein
MHYIFKRYLWHPLSLLEKSNRMKSLLVVVLLLCAAPLVMCNSLGQCSVRGVVLTCYSLGSIDISSPGHRYGDIQRIVGHGWNTPFVIDGGSFQSLRTVVLSASSCRCAEIVYTAYTVNPMVIINRELCTREVCVFFIRYFKCTFLF